MMIVIKTAFLAIVAALAMTTEAIGNDMLIDDFSGKPAERWRFFADSVMGGVSSGQVDFKQENGAAYAQMTGTVSTANNGGFIQFRRKLDGIPAGTIKGIRLVARGNKQRYFVHLRTFGTILPWQYYQAGFDVSDQWQEVRLPLDSFERSGKLLRKVPKASSLESVGIVAFGRDHRADIQVREIGFY
jgi:hypothetical protein